MLREEIEKALTIFDIYCIPEETQRNLLLSGVNFDFTYGSPDPNNRNRYYNVFEFANFLNICQRLNINLDINDLLSRPYDSKYEELVHATEAIEKFNSARKLEKKVQ